MSLQPRDSAGRYSAIRADRVGLTLVRAQPRFAPRAHRLEPRRAGAIFWCKTMLIRVTCPCGHVGIVPAATLPRELQCSACGSRRRVEADHGKLIYSQERFAEWIAGTRERPQIRRKAATLATA
jgi:hypothetical protein